MTPYTIMFNFEGESDLVEAEVEGNGLGVDDVLEVLEVTMPSSFHRFRANMAHIRVSRSDSGLGFQLNVSKRF